MTEPRPSPEAETAVPPSSDPSRSSAPIHPATEDALASIHPNASTIGETMDAPDLVERSVHASIWSIVQPPRGETAPLGPEPPRLPPMPLESGEMPAPGPAYTLRRVVGRGGMGEVWEAVQTSLGRVVAVKRVRPDKMRDSASRAARCAQFRQEAFAAAGLDHPNILPIIDLGMDHEGAPLLAMKLVNGEPWDETLAADFAALPPRDFLGRHVPILVNVAQAVAFAHARGIVHRDLKPSQVMTGEFGEALLMDWGLAMRYDPAGAARDLAAAPRPPLPDAASATNPAGTPALMAPEQTEQTASNIGPWTDVYLLGATLYFLLTGTYPRETRVAREAMRLAAEGAVEHPSSRAPGRDMPRDLADLAMKAMAPRPEERVGSAREFVVALQDYVSGSSRRRESEDLVRSAGQALDPTRGAPDYDRCGSALATLGQAAALWPDNPNIPALRERALAAFAEEALRHGDLMLARLQAESIPRGEAARAQILMRVESRERKLVERERARRAARWVAWALAAIVVAGSAILGTELLRERQTALDRARQSNDLVQFMLDDVRRQLNPDDPRDAALIEALADKVAAHYAAIDPTRESRAARLALAADLNNVGLLLHGLARYDDARRLFEGSLRLHRELLGENDPNVAANLNNLAAILFDLGRYREAARAHREALAARKASLGRGVETAQSMNNLALALAKLGENPEAEKLLREALDIRAELDDAAGPSSAKLHNNLAFALKEQGKAEEALGPALGAKAIWERERPANQEEICPNLATLASIYCELGRLDEGLALAERAVEIMRHAAGLGHPETAKTVRALAEVRLRRGEFAEAERLARQSAAIMSGASERARSRDLESALVVAEALAGQGRHEEAIEEWEVIARASDDWLGPRHPWVAMALAGRAQSLAALGRQEEAREDAKRALAAYERLAADQPGAPRWRREAEKLRPLAP